MIWYITGMLSSAYIGGVIGWVLHHYRTKAKIAEIKKELILVRKMYKIVSRSNRAMQADLIRLRSDRRREVYDYKKEGDM